MTAPATIGAGMSMLWPMPMAATPMVPMVAHELPMASVTMQQIEQIVNRNIDGESSSSP